MILQPADIILDYNDRSSFTDIVAKWGLNSPYTHSSLYLGASSQTNFVPAVLEALADGAHCRPISGKKGQRVAVIHVPWLTPMQRARVVVEALALDGSHAYDYDDLLSVAINCLLNRGLLKLHLPYRRDVRFICSECTAEPFWRAGIMILPMDREPLPPDFLKVGNPAFGFIGSTIEY